MFTLINNRRFTFMFVSVLLYLILYAGCSNPAGPSKDKDRDNPDDSTETGDSVSSFFHGKIQGSTYINEFIGIEITGPGGWTVTVFSSDNEGDTTPAYLAEFESDSKSGNFSASVSIFAGHMDGEIGDCAGEGALIESAFLSDEQWSDMSFSPTEQLAIGDTIACSVHFGGTFSEDGADGISVNMRQVLFSHNGYLVILVLTDTKESFDETDALFTALLKAIVLN